MVFGVLLEVVFLNFLNLLDVMLTGKAFYVNPNTVELNPIFASLGDTEFTVLLVFKVFLMIIFSMIILYTHVRYMYEAKQGSWTYYLFGKPNLAMHFLTLAYLFVVINNYLSLYHNVHLFVALLSSVGLSI